MKVIFTKRSWPLPIILLFLIGSGSISLQAQDYFKPLKNAPKHERYKISRNIYFHEIGKLEINYARLGQKFKKATLFDTTAAVRALKQLDTLAGKENDRELHAIFLAFMGDFYTRHRVKGPAHQFLNQALSEAVSYGLKQVQADVYANIGLAYYYINHDHKQGFEYILKANSFIEKEIGFNHYVSAGDFLYKLGSMYYDFGNISKARNYLYRALQHPFINKLQLIAVYNTIALCYRTEDNPDSAAAYFFKAAALAEAENAQTWIGITKGNLGLLYFNQNKPEAAKPLLQTDLDLSIKNEEWGSAGNIMCISAEMSLSENNLIKASRELDSAKLFYQRQSGTSLFRYYKTKSLLNRKLGNFSVALAFSDSAKKIEDSVARKNNLMVYARIEENIEMEKYLSDKKLMEIENKRLVLVRNFILVLLALIIIIAVQFIVRMRAKQKRDRQMMKMAKDQLADYIDHLRNKNEMIEDFQQEIGRLNTLSGYMLQKEKDEMSEKLRRYTILTDDHWNEFRHLFERVHTGFFEKLKQKYSNLTPAEIRMLALLRLNLSKNEIAEMLGISHHTVKKTRQRIQAKIELPENTQLEDIVLTI